MRFCWRGRRKKKEGKGVEREDEVDSCGAVSVNRRDA